MVRKEDTDKALAELGATMCSFYRNDIKSLPFILENKTSAEIKQELHLLIEKTDSELLELVYSLLKKNVNVLNLSDAQLSELERRYKAHVKNPHEGSSWEEVKNRISRKSK